MKKLFTTILMMGVALCGWATITETSSGNTVTLNYVADGNSNDQNFNLSNTNATTIVLTGDWSNKDLQKIGSIVGSCSNNVFLDLRACQGFKSTVVPNTTNNPVDWTSDDFTFLPNPNNPETVNRTGTARESSVYYNSWALDESGQPQSWATPYTGDVQGDSETGYHTPDGQSLVKFSVYVDENGKELPNNSVTENPDGTYSYNYTETLDSTPFSLAGNDFSNNAKYLRGIAFPNSPNFNAIPNKLFGDDGAPKLDGQQVASLDSIALGSNIVYIGGFAFKNSQVKYVDFPAGLKVIGPEAFDNSALKKVDLSGCTSLVAIKYEAFEFCSQLKTLIFPAGDTFTFLGNDAFKQTAIETLNMSMCDGIREFKSKNNDGATFKTFLNCTSLTYVSLPPNLTAVPDDSGNGVFNGCINIEKVQFNGTAVYGDACNITNKCTIGDGAFRFAQQSSTEGENTEEEIVLNKLATVILSNNISSIGIEAFHSAAITEIHIPASVEVLKKHCFYGCQNLTNVYFDACEESGCVGAATQVAGGQGDGGQGQAAFEECQHITDVYINTLADLDCANNAFDQDITWGAGDAGAKFAMLHYPKEKIEHYVNTQHYLTDAIVANAGKFHDWLEEHYQQAIIPHKNGWYEFINQGPTVPNNGPDYQDIILRTFSDWDYAYLVPNGLRAYVVNNIEQVGDNYEVSLQRLRVIPKKTGVILYGHPNSKDQNNKLSLVLTPVKFLETGDPLFDQKYNDEGELIDCDIEYNEDGTMKQQDTYRGPDQGAPLCRANWGNLDASHMKYKNYLEPIISSDGSRVAIKPYETVTVDGVKKITYRNFGLGRYTSTDYYKKAESNPLNDETNYVGFFRMKPQDYVSGYAYLRLRADVDEEGHALPYTNSETKEVYVSEFPVATSGEILVKPDEPVANVANDILPYYYEYKMSTGVAYDAREKVGDASLNPKRWWDDTEVQPIPFTWREYTLSWGDRSTALKDQSAAKYFGELEENADGIVKIVIPAGNESGEHYTLQGVKVTNPTKGIYIQNGKKVIIK